MRAVLAETTGGAEHRQRRKTPCRGIRPSFRRRPREETGDRFVDLSSIRPHLAPNAVVVVDDVRDNNRWDGAYQAFTEFVAEQGLDHRFAGNKCGIIEF